MKLYRYGKSDYFYQFFKVEDFQRKIVVLGLLFFVVFFSECFRVCSMFYLEDI